MNTITPKTKEKDYVTGTGVTLHLTGISQLFIDSMRASVVYPDPPTYEAELPGGEKEIHFHDETTLETDEDHEKWDAYKREYAKVDMEFRKKFTDAILIKGIDFEYPDDSEWIEESEFLGVKVPEEKFPRKLHYIYNEAIAGPDDLAAIVQEVMELSQLPREVLDQARNSFRGALEKVSTADKAEIEGGTMVP